MKGLMTFLGGAAVGAIAALLLAPESGEDTRARLKALLNKKLNAVKTEEDELDVLMERISSELEQEN